MKVKNIIVGWCIGTAFGAFLIKPYAIYEGIVLLGVAGMVAAFLRDKDNQ